MVRCGAVCGKGRRLPSRYSSPGMRRRGPGRRKYTGNQTLFICHFSFSAVSEF